MNPPLRYAILAAVSSKEQAQADKTSLPNQVKDGRSTSQARGWIESAGPFSIPGQSRTKYINLRDAEREIPALRALLDSAARGEYDVLIMQDHDRFRSLLRAVYQALCDYHVQLYSLAQPVEPVPPLEFDPYANDSADMYIGVSEIRSSAEISRMRRKYKSGMRDRIRVHGLPVQLPYGYDYPPRYKRSDRPAPVPDPELSPYLIELKDRMLRGQSIRQLVDYLTESGLTPPRSSVWHPGTVREMLKNPFYAGVVRFEVTKVKKDRRNNLISRDRSHPENAVTNRGVHEPLWTEDEHKAIVAEFQRRSHRKGKYQGRKNNQFTGLLSCGECGTSLWRYKNGPRALKDRMVWRCPENPTGHIIIAHVELIQKVGATMFTSLGPHLEDRELPQPDEPAPPPGPSLDNLKAQLRRLEEAYRKGRYDPEHYDEDWDKLTTQIHEIENKDQLEETRRIERLQRLDGLGRTFGPYLHKIPRWLEERDPVEINRVMHLLFETIVIHRIQDDYQVELVYK